jgi:hypothetical protein
MLAADDISLLVAAGDVTESSYSFRCPCCHDRVVKPADEIVVRLLLSAGVEPVAWHGQGELVDAAPALTDDDLLDFILAMRGTDHLAAAAAEELV